MLEWQQQRPSSGRSADFTLDRGVDRPVTGAVWAPAAVTPATPLVLCGHGASGDRFQAPIPTLAKELTAVGCAVLSVDGPVHGLRAPSNGLVGRDALRVEMTRGEVCIDDMVADWKAAISSVCTALGLAEDCACGYFGLSMGSIFGVPLVAELQQRGVITCAVLGLLGTTGAVEVFGDRFKRDAATISCPIGYIIQLEDELFPRGGQLELFDALGSNDKRIHAHPGLHGFGGGPEEVHFTVSFLTSRFNGNTAIYAAPAKGMGKAPVMTTGGFADLDGQVAIVTGGAEGIGGGVSRCLARAGARVLIADTNLPRAQETADEICANGNYAVAMRVDVGSSSEVKAMVDRALTLWGRLDILINNAYALGAGVGGATELDEKAWDAGVSVGLKSHYIAAKFAVPAMAETGGGSVVSLSSVHGLLAAPDALLYDTIKHAVVGMTKQMAVQYGKLGVRFNAIAPGHIVTEKIGEMWEADPERLKYFIDQYPVGRVGRPVDIGNAVTFLCSEQASFITGQTLAVDGGLAIQLQEDFGMMQAAFLKDNPVAREAVFSNIANPTPSFGDRPKL